MAIDINNHYGSYCTNTFPEVQKEKQQSAEAKEDWKKSSRDNVQAYYEKLCKKFPGITFNTGGVPVRGSENKVVVNLSYDCLRKMANDPEFAKNVEFNLTGVIPAHKGMYAKARRDGVEIVGGVTTVLDADGNCSVSCGGMRTANTGSGSSHVKKAQKKKQTEKTDHTKEVSEAEEMAAFKKEFYARSGNSFYKRTGEKHEEQKALLEAYLEKRAQTKELQHKALEEKVAQRVQDRGRLVKKWNDKRQMAGVSNAYEANVRIVN